MTGRRALRASVRTGVNSHSSTSIRTVQFFRSQLHRRRWVAADAHHSVTLGDVAFDMLAPMQREGLLCDVTLMAGESPDDQTEADTQMCRFIEHQQNHKTCCFLSTEAEDDQENNTTSTLSSQVGISAHRCILAACSPYFYAMFTGTMSEARQSHVYIHGVTSEALHALVQYIYTHEIVINDDNVQVMSYLLAFLYSTSISVAFTRCESSSTDRRAQGVL